MKRIKTFLKWVFIFLAVIVTIPILIAAGIWGKYRSIVNAGPGEIKTTIAPGALGAHVDPFIGTGGVSWMCAHNSPAATMPFGMVRLAPDTASLILNDTCLNRSGYFYGDNKIIGFSHSRLLGADSQEGGVFRILPSTKAFFGRPDDELQFSHFSHANEVAMPGYYAVRLHDEGILAELTATTRVGVHRYTFPVNVMPRLMLDVSSVLGKGRSKDASVTVLPDKYQIEGHVKIFGSFSGRYDGLDVYFVAQTSVPIAEQVIWGKGDGVRGPDSGQGDELKVDLGFAAQATEQTVEVRLALSYVSIANARENLAAEALNKSFDEIAGAARDAWEQKLNLIMVEGGTARQQRIFYTALYRALQMPTTFNDVNGEYTGFDRAVHKADGFTYYTDFSLWDSFRTVHPLYNVIARGEQRDMMVSLLEMAKAGGCFPRWPSGCGYTNCMFGTPADVAVSEAYLKGIRDFDIETAYAKLRETALTGKPEGTRFAGREHLNDYLQYGYCPSDVMSDAVSATLEYSWCDTALAGLARELGHEEDAAGFEKRSKSYRNLWDSNRLFFVPKDTKGVFTDVFDPLVLSYTDSARKFTDDFVEGSAMQWRWSVPYDADGLVALFPSKEKFVSELEQYFEKSNDTVGYFYPGSNYWHGNEPYIHGAYLFNAAGRPDLTQKWVRHLLETKYSDDYVGLDGNDDGGTLSSWYVFSALGIYPIAGTTKYELGAPLFAKAVVNMGEGKVLTVLAENYAPENMYVASVTLNGVAVEGHVILHEQIANGGELRFVMRATAGGG